MKNPATQPTTKHIALLYPTALPPIQMNAPKKSPHRNEATP